MIILSHPALCDHNLVHNLKRDTYSMCLEGKACWKMLNIREMEEKDMGSLLRTCWGLAVSKQRSRSNESIICSLQYKTYSLVLTGERSDSVLNITGSLLSRSRIRWWDYESIKKMSIEERSYVVCKILHFHARVVYIIILSISQMSYKGGWGLGSWIRPW